MGRDDSGRFSKEPGTVIREWLVEKLGNPAMGSKKQDAVNEATGETEQERRDRALADMQQRGEDYDAKLHGRSLGR
jgi:hypothetical protein